MSNLVNHAKTELELAGLLSQTSDYNGMIGRSVLELMETFSKQGHSGFSAAWVTEIFTTLAKFQPLTPITSNPEEWCDVSEASGGNPMWQNRRKSSTFSKDGGQTWYDLDDPTDEEQR